MLLFLTPGYLATAARRGEQDGLALTRQVWLAFFLALPLVGIVALLVAVEPTTSATPWVLGLAVATVVLLAAEGWALARPLNCEDRSGLATSYRSRFFLAMAFSDAIALQAFATAMVTGRAWIFWGFYPFALIGQLRDAPTPAKIAADQERLRDRGCQLSLVGALRQPGPS